MQASHTRAYMLSVAIASAIVVLTQNFCVWAQAPDSALDDDFANLPRYEVGDASAGLVRIVDAVGASHEDEAARSALEARLLSVMKSGDATFAAKEFASKQLYRICSDAVVFELAPLLVSNETSDIVRYIIERIPGEAAGKVLLQALAKTKGSTRVGIINSLANRRDPNAVVPLRNLSGNGDAQVMRAAIEGLGRIGGDLAARAALWCSANVRHDLRPVATQAYLRCADSFFEAGEVERAIDMYDALSVEVEPVNIRMAALRGLIHAEGEDATQTVLDTLEHEGDPKVRAVAIEGARGIPGADASRILGNSLSSLDPDVQVMLLGVLASRGDSEGLPAVKTAARNLNVQVRIAALEAMGDLGDISVVTMLLKAASRPEDDEQKAARKSLHRLNAPDVDDAIIQGASSANNAIRGESFRCIGARGSTGAMPVLIRAAERDVEALRIEALKALGAVSSQENLGELVEFLIAARSDKERKQAERTVLTVARVSAKTPERTAAVRGALSRESGPPELHVALVRILGALADESSLSDLQGAARKQDATVRRAAVQALAAWPNAGPLADLARIAQTESDLAIQNIAFNGFVRILREDDAITVEEALAQYGQAVTWSLSRGQKMKLLSGLAEVKDPGAAALVAPFLEDPEVSQEAALAQEKINAS